MEATNNSAFVAQKRTATKRIQPKRHKAKDLMVIMATKKSVGTTLLALALVVVVLNVLTLSPMGVAAAGDKPLAHAIHILVPTEEECDEIAAELMVADDLEATFAKLAKARSKCPSSRKGGDLGAFGRGQMVPEFDTVAFEKPVGDVHKVKTQVHETVAPSNRLNAGVRSRLTIAMWLSCVSAVSSSVGTWC
ncbi:hypothetical protein BBJ28_00018290 [Nothophytophthora sp. Chile5]|nr:hypothetical protein BBJ28_00018290 [Nothophytophthora sp. Chile5]